jgi:carbon monoxide dehydrogenase subunit G
MNEIQKIQSQIDAVAEMLLQVENLLAKEPNNFSHQLSIDSLKAQISGLEKQMMYEKAKRDKEVIEIRLKGRTADGTIPLEVLAKLADGLSGTVLNASYFIQFGQKVKKIKVKEVHDIVNLRLAGISTGSTRLFITANTSPDLFGRSLAEESLKHSFNLLQSESADELTESASKIGKESVRKLYKFITTISNAEMEVDLKWNSPTSENYNWEGNKQTLLRVAQSLTNIQMSDPETIDFSGELIVISLRGTFEIKLDDKRTIRGEFPNNLLEEIKTLTIGSNYAGKMEEQTIVNMATESVKVYYTLISIRHI